MDDRPARRVGLGKRFGQLGLPFDQTGPVHVPRALAPVHCDVDHGVATYVEPNVWIVHRTGG